MNAPITNLSEENNKNLIVESLKPNHLTMLALSKQTERLGWMQIMLIRTLLSEAEVKLPNLLPTRHPRCLLALENEQLIALLVLQPNNRRGTSWSISVPEFLKESKFYTRKQICRILLNKALKIENNVAQSWIIRCPSTDSQQLEIARELGFQPLRNIKRWTFKPTINKHHELTDTLLLNNFSFENLSKSNAPLLWRLQIASQSVHLRELIDRQWIDLLDRNDPENKVLFPLGINQNTPLFGLVTPIGSEDLLSLELIRGIAWDSRLNCIIPRILRNVTNTKQHIFLETPEKDNHLNEILKQTGWIEKSEKILLGKSLLKRRTYPKTISQESSLEKLLKNLQPNQPSMPNPTLDFN